MAANNPNQITPRRNRGFCEFWSTTDPIQVTNVVNYAPTQVVDWFVPDNPTDTNLVETLLAWMIGVTPNLNVVPIHALNILVVAYPSLADGMKEELRSRGSKQREVKLPSQLEEHSLRMPQTVLSQLHLSIVYATLLILMLKNITQATYDDFINRKIAALREVVGLPNSDNVGLKVFTFERANAFRSSLGVGLKRLVLNKVLPYVVSNTPDSKAMLYASRIVAWSDMTAFNFIVDELVRTNSPVLAHLVVRSEFDALRRALKAVFASPYPQFFKFLAPYEHSYLVERNNFPILAAVAWELRKETYPTLQQLIGGTNVNTGLVTQLVNIHKSFIRERRVNSTGH
ncbi:hypothetical protein LUZ62_065246 [Rhynchospora pubera]|uniref:Uncharacterized protein n=1 Tax=Rhynchospora pubera TaxID=906938 RepID=A0AAV8EJW7_9POAL|nr:hypothetical protein LUZ62_065246 [Rhynchospora pubera]